MQQNEKRKKQEKKNRKNTRKRKNVGRGLSHINPMTESQHLRKKLQSSVEHKNKEKKQKNTLQKCLKNIYTRKILLLKFQ